MAENETRQSDGIPLTRWKIEKYGGNSQAIVSTVSKSVLSPCLNTNETVSVVPVEGAHVMLNGVPAVMLVRDVKVNGF